MRACLPGGGPEEEGERGDEKSSEGVVRRWQIPGRRDWSPSLPSPSQRAPSFRLPASCCAKSREEFGGSVARRMLFRWTTVSPVQLESINLLARISISHVFVVFVPPSVLPGTTK